MTADGSFAGDASTGPPPWLEAYRGLTAEECQALAQREHRPIRVIQADSVVTADYVAQRLNVQVGQAGQVIDIYHG